MAVNLVKLDSREVQFMIFGTETQRKIASDLIPYTIIGDSCYPIESVQNLNVNLFLHPYNICLVPWNCIIGH